MKRSLTLPQAQARYVHRYTLDHVPKWAKTPLTDGRYPAPHFASDEEWYQQTVFPGELRSDGQRHHGNCKYCITDNLTWPLGQEPLPTWPKAPKTYYPPCARERPKVRPGDWVIL